MKAAVASVFDAPLEILDRAVPEPGPDEVLVRLETCGLCHTDIHAAHGDWPVKPGLPFVPGHEGVGIVEKLGAGVTNRVMGERVAIAWLGYACGECRYCIDGRETLCEQQHNSGYSVDGAAEVDPVAAIRSLGGADVAVVLAASLKVFEQALSSLARGGRLICVALPAEQEMNISIFETVLKGISIIGSIVGTRQDLAEVFSLHAAGHMKIVAEGRRLEQVNDAIAEVLSGKVLARLVFEY